MERLFDFPRERFLVFVFCFSMRVIRALCFIARLSFLLLLKEEEVEDEEGAKEEGVVVLGWDAAAAFARMLLRFLIGAWGGFAC